MSKPTVLDTDFAPFFDLVALHLVAGGICHDTSRITPVAVSPEDVPHFVGDSDILLWPQGETSEQSAATGGGRLDTRSIALLFVVVRSRCELDQSDSDRFRLIDASLGHYGLRQKVRDALQLFWPEDSGANAMGVQPMRWLRTQPPRREKNKHWIYSILEFEVLYPVALT